MDEKIKKQKNIMNKGMDKLLKADKKMDKKMESCEKKMKSKKK